MHKFFTTATTVLFLLIALTVDVKAIEDGRTVSFLAKACNNALIMNMTGVTPKNIEDATALAYCSAAFMGVADTLQGQNLMCLDGDETYADLALGFVVKYDKIMETATLAEIKTMNDVSFVYPVIGHLMSEYSCNEKEKDAVLM